VGGLRSGLAGGYWFLRLGRLSLEVGELILGGRGVGGFGGGEHFFAWGCDQFGSLVRRDDVGWWFLWGGGCSLGGTPPSPLPFPAPRTSNPHPPPPP